MDFTNMINRELIRLKVVQLIYSYYQNKGKTLDIAEKELEFSLNKAYELYLYLLSLLVEIKRYAELRNEVHKAREQRMGETLNTLTPDEKLANNLFLQQLTENKALIEYQEKRKGQWDEESSLIKKLYAQIMESEIFHLYLSEEDFSYSAEREVIRKIYKTYICNNENIDSIIEEHSLYWNDDKTIIDSFVLKTIKRFTPESDADTPLLPNYSSEEDRQFALQLFRNTITREEELRSIIQGNTKNWEFNRLAFMDIIILQIAIAEILTFNNIPLNVTFNEYIDIAKIYSTPKSSSYINGMLDGIVKQLYQEGRITKTRDERK